MTVAACLGILLRLGFFDYLGYHFWMKIDGSNCYFVNFEDVFSHASCSPILFLLLLGFYLCVYFILVGGWAWLSCWFGSLDFSQAKFVSLLHFYCPKILRVLRAGGQK